MKPAPAELLPWDTQFFGLRIGRVNPGPFMPSAVETWRRENRVRCLYYLAELTDMPSIHAAQDAGFHLVDIRTTFTIPLPIAPHILPATTSIRLAVETDLPSMQEMTAGSYVHSRFFHDPHFPRAKCDEMYAIWVEKQFHQAEAAIWVTEDASGVLGFVTVVELSPHCTSISLIGIAERARGQGLGKALVNHVLRESSRRGYQALEVVTQARNTGAMHLYQSCGLQMVLQQAWLHGWCEERE